MMSDDEHASKHSSQCEIMVPLTGCLSPVKAPCRTKNNAADEGFDKAYRLLQTLSCGSGGDGMTFRLSRKCLFLTCSEPLDDGEFQDINCAVGGETRGT